MEIEDAIGTQLGIPKGEHFYFLFLQMKALRNPAHMESR